MIAGDTNRYRMNGSNGDVYVATPGTSAAFNRFIFQLHANLFLGTKGIIFLGIVSFLFFLSTLTGIFIYGPFMQSTLFGVMQFDPAAK